MRKIRHPMRTLKIAAGEVIERFLPHVRARSIPLLYQIVVKSRAARDFIILVQTSVYDTFDIERQFGLNFCLSSCSNIFISQSD